MAAVTLKTEIAPIDGTPIKRFFLSIINDYDHTTGLCELIDNAVDLWLASGRKKPLNIDVVLDVDEQFISVRDDAGGVGVDDLNLLITPGGSGNRQEAEVIGIFGVGSKRAGIALGKHVEIKTRFAKRQSHQIDITDEWLAQPNWEIPAYAIPGIEPGTTRVEISRLRQPFDRADIERLQEHLSDTYAWFLQQGCAICVNGNAVAARVFDSWAFPRGQPWTLGLVEAISAVTVIGRQKLETRNRIALILLDSNFEIALKEFIVHERKLFPPSVYTNSHIENLFGRRPNVIADITSKIAIDPKLLARAQHYYGLRNKLIHERVTADVTDSDIENYRDTVQKILSILFKLRFPAG